MSNFEELENRISMSKHGDKYSLVFSNRECLVENCDIVSYLSRKFIAVKTGNTVTVYKPTAEYCSVSDRFKLQVIAEMSCVQGTNVTLRIQMNESIYLIDQNAQISMCKCHSS